MERLKKNHTMISILSEKLFDKIQHPFIIKKKKKSIQKVGIVRTYLNILKAIYNEPTANIILNIEKNENNFSKIKNKTRVATFTTITQHRFESYHGNQR